MTASRAVIVAAAVAAALSLRPASAAEPGASEPRAFDLTRAQLQCAQGSLDVDALLRDSARDKTLDRALFGGAEAASRAADDYLLCRALPAGRDPLCANIPARVEFCRDEAAFMRFIWAAFKDGDGPARCVETLPPEARGGGSAKVCELLSKAVRAGGSPDEVCAQARSVGLPPALARDCPGDLAFIAGDPQRCASAGRDGRTSGRCRRRAELVLQPHEGGSELAFCDNDRREVGCWRYGL